VVLLTALAAVGCSVYCLARFYTFHYGAYDLVIFDQAVRSYAHFSPGISIIKGCTTGSGRTSLCWGNHRSPILASLAPCTGSPTARRLCWWRSRLFALAIPPLWVFTRRAFGGGPQATGRRAVRAPPGGEPAAAIAWR
jgi:uncharacterized membrane protein